MRALLRVPLAGKLAGANALIVLTALGAATLLRDASDAGADRPVLVLLAAALGAGLVVNVALVMLALRPLRDLEQTAERIWRGDLDARVPASLLADSDIARIGSALNVLLDVLTSDRARMRRLAAEVIRAGDRERASIARELHDSTAQTLAALLLHISAVVRDSSDPELSSRLSIVKTAASEALEEVRNLAHVVHPRVLDDLGLVAALRNLARHIEQTSGISVVVEDGAPAQPISPAAAAVLYRVAQDAVANAVRHANASVIVVGLSASNGAAVLTVTDDGHGFEVGDVERTLHGMGLFTMRERVSLADGRFELTSAPGAGTRVLAEVPFDHMDPS